MSSAEGAEVEAGGDGGVAEPSQAGLQVEVVVVQKPVFMFSDGLCNTMFSDGHSGIPNVFYSILEPCGIFFCG